jgi:adenosine deaminase
MLYRPEQLEFCQALPKIELHAHLNGSIRDATLR